ncbi:MAG: phage tail tube protein, partial [Ilumatobacteraceae bacterium]
TYSPDTLKSLTIQIGKPDTGGVVRVFDYIGMMVQSWSMSIRPKEFVQMSTEFRGLNETITETLATASYSVFTGFTFAHASLTIGGTEYCVDSLDVTGTNNLDVTNKICSTNPGAPTIREAGMWEYGGNFEMDFENLDLYTLYRNATEGALVVTLDAGASAKLIMTMNVRLDGDTPSVSGPEILKQTIPFVATSASTDAAAYTAVLTNGDSTP